LRKLISIKNVNALPTEELTMMSPIEVLFWGVVAVAIMLGIYVVLSRIWEFMLDKWDDFHYWVETRNAPPSIEEDDTEPLPVISQRRFRIHDSTEGIPDNLPPGTRVEFPNGHYIITRPAHIQTNGYGRMTNKPRHPIKGFTYTI
jgi:hypothetical protein